MTGVDRSACMEYEHIEACPLCHSHSRDVYYKATRHDHGNGDIDRSVYACTSSGYGRYPDIVQCRDCQLIYLSLHPSAQSLEDIYKAVEDDTYLQEAAGRVK